MIKSSNLLPRPGFLLMLILWLISPAAFAQFTDSTHYHATLSATGSVNHTQDGNTYLFTNAADLAMKKKDYSFNLAGNYVYGKSGNALTNRDYLTVLTGNLFKYAPFEHSFYWGLVSYNSSFSLKINNQTQAGAGFAYSLIDTKNAYINFSDGVVYDQSDLVAHDSIPFSYHTYRNSFRLMLHFNIKDIFVFDSGSFLQNSFRQSGDYIIRTNTSLTLKIKKWIGLTTALAYSKQNNTGSENLLFTYGLTIDKYF